MAIQAAGLGVQAICSGTIAAQALIHAAREAAFLGGGDGLASSSRSGAFSVVRGTMGLSTITSDCSFRANRGTFRGSIGAMAGAKRRSRHAISEEGKREEPGRIDVVDAQEKLLQEPIRDPAKKARKSLS